MAKSSQSEMLIGLQTLKLFIFNEQEMQFFFFSGGTTIDILKLAALEKRLKDLNDDLDTKFDKEMKKLDEDVSKITKDTEKIMKDFQTYNKQKTLLQDIERKISADKCFWTTIISRR